MENLRDSGMEIIGPVNWGTHIGKLYSSKDDFLNLVPYIYAGLKNNELCIWIYSQNTSYEEIRDMMGKYIDNTDFYLEKGQLLLISYLDWYIEKDTFNEVRTNTNWREYIQRALVQGYDGLRAVADTYWLEKSFYRDFTSYERRINDMISNLPFLVVCMYDAKKLDAYEIAGILKNHSFIITMHDGNQELIMNNELVIKDKQLERSEKEYKKLLDILPSAVFIHDNDNIYYCNDSALEMIRLKAISLPFKKENLKTIASSTLDRSYRFLNLIDDFDKLLCTETKFEYSNGDFKYFEIISINYNFYGHPTFISIAIDKSPFKQIEKLEEDISATMELDKIKTEFFSSFSHELRTPINVILGVIQLLEFQNLPDNVKIKDSKYLKIMKQNCLRLVRLVNNIIDLTKMDSDYFNVCKQNYDIIGLTKDITNSVVEFAANKGIGISFEANRKERIMACDPDQIERIMLNLLSNAIKFTKTGGIVSVKVTDAGQYVQIKVKDNGIGIPEGKLPKIFNRFEQVDKSLQRECEGSGIGLALVKALVEKHNGNISVISEIGVGSEFTVDLPVEVIRDNKMMIMENNYVSDYHNYVERINVEFSDIYA